MRTRTPAFQASHTRKGLPLETGLMIKLAIGAVVPRCRPRPQCCCPRGGGIALVPAIKRGIHPTTMRTMVSRSGSCPPSASGIAAVMLPILSEATAFPPATAEEWLPLAAVSLGLLRTRNALQASPVVAAMGTACGTARARRGGVCEELHQGVMEHWHARRGLVGLPPSRSRPQQCLNECSSGSVA